ncbi:unnamed protein product [Brassica napus]|uniref:(rape) hypothetical protein n=1 Tax=Brassica napus TaxID=3708 RepID=A0A816IFR2_BRANA|nr:unnamed protein product [Brassica napus]
MGTKELRMRCLSRSSNQHHRTNDRFCVKVTDHNFSCNTRAITVTKVLSQDIPPHTEESVGNNNAAASKVTMLTRDEVSESSKSRGDCANEESKRGYDTADPEKAKRPRCEN